MKAIITALSLAFILTACSQNKNQAQTDDSNDNPDEQEWITSSDGQVFDGVEGENDNPTREHYTFKVSYDYGEDGQPGDEIMGIIVTAYIDGKKTDITFSSDEISGLNGIDEENEIDWYSEEDINFDGYPDLLLYCGMGGPYFTDDYYKAYVWDPELKEFDYVAHFQDILNPSFDPEKKTVKGSYEDDEGKVTEYYRWGEGGNFLEKVSEQIARKASN